MKTVLMKQTTRGSNDGATVSMFDADQVYEVSDSLAADFESMGVAVVAHAVEGVDPADLDAAQLTTIAEQLGVDTVAGATEEEILAAIDETLAAEEAPVEEAPVEAVAEDTVAGALADDETQDETVAEQKQANPNKKKK